MIYEPVEFPAVTFCNLNNIMNSRLSLGGKGLKNVVDSAKKAYAPEADGRQKRSVRKQRLIKNIHEEKKDVTPSEKAYNDTAKDVNKKPSSKAEQNVRNTTQNIDADVTEMKRRKHPLIYDKDDSQERLEVPKAKRIPDLNRLQNKLNASNAMSIDGYRLEMPSISAKSQNATSLHFASRHKREACE